MRYLFLLLISVQSVIGFSFGPIGSSQTSEIQDIVSTTFSVIKANEFTQSPIPGIYELVTNGKVIYFQPEKEIMIFGEMYSKEGVSLTQERLREVDAVRIGGLDLKDALVIGSGPKKIIEFTDPECGYCKNFHAYSKTVEPSVTRYIFFTPMAKLHPEGHKKAIHILCSENKEIALNDVYGNRIDDSDLLHCDSGQVMLNRHQQISEQFGVQGTPTFVLENTVITGFNQAQIAQFIYQE